MSKKYEENQQLLLGKLRLHVCQPIRDLKGALSRYSELFSASTKLPLNGRKPENNAIQSQKNIKEMIINHKGKRLVEDGEG